MKLLFRGHQISITIFGTRFDRQMGPRHQAHIWRSHNRILNHESRDPIVEYESEKEIGADRSGYQQKHSD